MAPLMCSIWLCTFGLGSEMPTWLGTIRHEEGEGDRCSMTPANTGIDVPDPVAARRHAVRRRAPVRGDRPCRDSSGAKVFRILDVATPGVGREAVRRRPARHRCRARPWPRRHLHHAQPAPRLGWSVIASVQSTRGKSRQLRASSDRPPVTSSSFEPTPGGAELESSSHEIEFARPARMSRVSGEHDARCSFGRIVESRDRW